MLQLYINNEQIDLFDNTKISLTYESPLFSFEEIKMAYSISVKIPETGRNLRITKFPNRIKSAGISEKYSFLLRFMSMTFIEGDVIVTYDEGILLNIKTAPVPDDALKNMSEIQLQKIEFQDASSMSPWEHHYKEYFSNYENGYFPEKNFVFAPIRILNEKYNKQNLSYWGMYLNKYNVERDNYMFMDHYNDEDKLARMSPCPFFNYLVRSVFGSSLKTNELEADPEWKKLVIIAQSHKLMNSGKFMLDSREDTSAYFYLNSFLENQKFNLFLKDILKLSCSTIDINSKGVHIYKNKNILKSSEIEDISGIINNVKRIYKSEGKNYKYGYQAKDEFTSGVLNDGNPKTEGVGEGIDIAYIKEDFKQFLLQTDKPEITKKQYHKEYNQVIELNKKTAEDGEITTSAETKMAGIEKPNDTENSISVVPEITSPVVMCVDDYWTRLTATDEERQAGNFKVPRGKWYVPGFETSYFEKNGVKIGLYQGMMKTIDSDNTYPFISNHNLGISKTNRLGDLSLHWTGENGLIEKEHKEYKEYRERDLLIVEAEALLSELQLKDILILKKRYFKGRKFFVKKLNVIVESQYIQPASLELIEAPE